MLISAASTDAPKTHGAGIIVGDIWTGLNDKLEMLAGMPEMASERRDFRPLVPIHHYEKHLIIYVIADAGILIVRALHYNMDVTAQMSG